MEIDRSPSMRGEYITFRITAWEAFLRACATPALTMDMAEKLEVLVSGEVLDAVVVAPV